jgi:hypothetical protein
MSASNENSRSYKSKLSLQKKFKLDIPVVSNQLNETSDFKTYLFTYEAEQRRQMEFESLFVLCFFVFACVISHF